MSESKVQLGSKTDLFFVKNVLLEAALKAGKDLTPKENKDLDKVPAFFFSFLPLLLLFVVDPVLPC